MVGLRVDESAAMTAFGGLETAKRAVIAVYEIKYNGLNENLSVLKGKKNMDKKSRKELLEEYKQLKTYMGVIQITNNVSRKIYISAYPNLKNRWLSIQSQLVMGRHANSQLQKDWKELGPETFTYEVLEEKEADEIVDMRWELKQMEKPWLEKLQPYGDRGYNKPPSKC